MLDRFFRAVILFFATCLLITSGRAASFTATLDRDTVTLGEQATLSLTFEGGQPAKLTPLEVPGLQFGTPSRSFSQNIDFNSGQVNARLVLSFPVTPQREGEFTIPAMTADVGGQAMASQPLKLTVTKPGATAASGANPDSQFAFARLALPQKEVYPGETITADLQLFYRQDTQLANQPQVAGAPADGFAVGKIAGGNMTLAQVGNAVFNVIPAKIALTATRTGALRVGPVTVSLDLLVPSNDRRSDPFDPFGMMRRSVEKPLSVATDALDVKAQPLPSKNVPPDFNGVVGNYTMTVSAGPTNVTVGDPITVRVQISGSGALDAVTLPPQDAWQNFKTYPPTTKLETSDQFGFQGTKTFEQIISPQNSSVHELPPLTFSFFNPDDGQYHTLTQAAVPLTVKAAAASPLPTLAANRNSAPENQPPQDILPIKESMGTLAQAGAPLIARPAFLALQSVPVLAFLAALVWRKRTDNLANNPRLRRQRAVAALIAGGMDDLKKYAAANQPDEFFATLFRLLQEQLGERLDCPASAITENVIDEHPVLRGAPKATLDGLRELFQLCNQARYAPVRGTSELNSVAAHFGKTIAELQEVKA